MSQKHLQRVVVIENAVEGRISVGRASELLQAVPLQIRRLKRKFSAQDAGWVVHGNPGRKPLNRVDEQTRQRVRELARGKYSGFNASNLGDKLAREENLVLSRSTVRRILRQAGLRSPPETASAALSPTPGAAYPGRDVLQVDASRHPWLEQRGPELTLLGFVDDATGQVAAAQFQAEPEDSAGYLRLLRP